MNGIQNKERPFQPSGNKPNQMTTQKTNEFSIEGKLFVAGWVTDNNGLPKEAVDFAETFGGYLVPDHANQALTTSQLRGFFGEMRRIQLKGFNNNFSSFLMLKPKLVYAKARVIKEKRDNRIKDFERVISAMIDKVAETKNEKHFENLIQFVEAVVAYHKANGGN